MKQGTNAAVMRQQNAKMILSLINQEPLSRADIAKITGLTRAAVTIITDELLNKGLISELPTKSSSVGRQPVLLLLNHDAMYTVGINIAREEITIAIADLGGNIAVEVKYPAMNPGEFEENIKQMIDELLQKTGIPDEKIYGIGVVTPGPIDADNQTILNPPNFKKWHNQSIAHMLGKLDFDIYHENVANGTALAEKYFGAAKGVSNFMALLVDTGIGSGIVLNHRLFAGINEVGHTSIQFDGKLCECGNRGCLEQYAAIPALLHGTGVANWQEAVDTEHAVVEKEAEYLSTAIINSNNLFDLERVVLCGDLSYRPERITALIEEKVSCRMLNKKELSVCAGKVTSRGLAACAAAVHRFYK